MAQVVLAVRLRVVHPAAKSLLADLVERPVVLLAVLVVLLRVLHLVVLVVPVVLVALAVPEALVVAPVQAAPAVCPICSAAPLRKPFLQ